ncbi:hypothetical protein H5410_035936 [Solanum commersonii]|uniref:Transposase MuDR plant domain-containing protein n=1 Tax=Solanum commersonii TaxID=4109 RepID=A0A9J5Y526_SOLCO|nr:hypothetical protein H5410_035936 [Solanum commersonii]
MNISILLRHSGVWESEINYERYKSDGILGGEDVSFMNLVSTIATELNIDESRKNIEIRYIVEGNSSPMNIRTDMGVRLYVEVKKHEIGFGMYPICIDTIDKDVVDIENFDVSTSSIVCVEHDCCWRFSASVRKKSNLFKIRYFNSEHTCPIRDMLLTNVQATVRFISVVTAPKLHNHKRIHTSNDVIEDIRSLYGIDISYKQAWRAKERALEIIRGKFTNGYRQLPKYLYMLETVYPNSYIRMHKSEEYKFMYLFISLRPLMRGFDYCRPVVVVDGAHLGGSYGGTFVSASTLDGAGMIFVLEF